MHSARPGRPAEHWPKVRQETRAQAWQGVWGGSATLDAATQSLRMVEVRGDVRAAWTLDVTVTTGADVDAVDLRVELGAGQTSATRTYRCERGRIQIPVVGDRVTVDALRVASPTVAPRVVVLLGEGGATGAAPSAATATGRTVTLAIGSNAVGESYGVARILRNDSAATVTVQIGGVNAFDLAPGASAGLDYTGPFAVVATAIGDFRVVTLHA